MTIEERARFEGLLENIQTSVNVIAEGHGALAERLDRFENRFDRLETRFDHLEMKVDALASDTQQRLERIETHLHLNGASSLSRKATKSKSPKRRKPRPS